MKSPNLCHLKAPGELIFIVDPDLIEPRRDRATFDRRHDGGAIADPRFFLDAADEAAADITLVNEYVAYSQPPLCGEMRQPRRSPGAARTTVDRTRSVEDRVAAMRTAASGFVRPHHVTYVADCRIEWMHGLDLLAHQL